MCDTNETNCKYHFQLFETTMKETKDGSVKPIRLYFDNFFILMLFTHKKHKIEFAQAKRGLMLL